MPSTSLDQLPQSILRQIASYRRSEREIRRFMSVCRSFRAAAEIELRSCLTVQSRDIVTYADEGDEPDIFDPFITINPMTPLQNTQRRWALRGVSERFDRHLTAYPSSATHMRRMRLELRDDQSAAQSILTRAAPRLEELHVCIFDRLWHLVTALNASSPSTQSNPDRIEWIRESAPQSFKCWRMILGDGDQLLHFPELTSLTIIATARVLSHLRCFAPSLPSLCSLTIGGHWVAPDDMSELAGEDIAGEPQELVFNNLRRLTIAGHSKMVISAMRAILPTEPHLQYLTLHLSEHDPPSLGVSDTNRILRCSSLEGFALFHPRGKSFLAWLQDMRDRGQAVPGWQHLRVLVFDRQHRPGEGGLGYPLLSANLPDGYYPNLPALERIAWVDEREDNNGKSVFGSPTDTAMTDVYAHPAVRNLFDRYPTLRHLVWTVGRPHQPGFSFGIFPPHDWELMYVGRCIYRMPVHPKDLLLVQFRQRPADIQTPDYSEEAETDLSWVVFDVVSPAGVEEFKLAELLKRWPWLDRFEA